MLGGHTFDVDLSRPVAASLLFSAERFEKRGFVYGQFRGSLASQHLKARGNAVVAYVRREWTDKRDRGPINHIETVPGGTAVGAIRVVVPFRALNVPLGLHWMRSVGVYECPRGQIEAPTAWRRLEIIAANAVDRP